MSQEQVRKPVTYGDAFPAAKQSVIGEQPITMEDAALMQSAEALAFGHTLKGGAASVMQSASATNVDQGFIDRDAHSPVAEYGVGITETTLPGAVMDIQYVAGQAVAGTAKPMPTDPAIAAMDAVTIGEALEAAAVGASDKPIDSSDARAIMSAERRATGVPGPVQGGVGSVAQSAAELNPRVQDSEKTTFGDVLMDATTEMSADKVVTYGDAEKIIEAELRGKQTTSLQPGGVGVAMLAAAHLNEAAGLISPPNPILHQKAIENLPLIAQVSEKFPSELEYERLDGVSPDCSSRQQAQEVSPTEIVGQESNNVQPISSLHAENQKKEEFPSDDKTKGTRQQGEIVGQESRSYQPLSSLSAQGDENLPTATYGGHATNLPDISTIEEQSGMTEPLLRDEKTNM